ncbi:uncharacterized protein LOC110676744 [Aedes aegypti]|uniref:Uncharacterized protein n=1 Tax=Aedes aegypti TaxID=7159 RepID=A0A6I8U9I0_AEDAE|nr:uncharacterized protein LOC110676744 [Aedes aegypti]
MPVEVPKKFYRNVFRGVSYFSQGQKRPCKLGELVAYVYLKNGRALQVNRIEAIVKEALADLCSSGVVKKTRNCYQLTEVLVGNLQEAPIAGPSGSANNSSRRRSRSGSRKTKTPSKRTKTPRRGPVDADEPEMEMVSDEESENDEEVEQRSEEGQQPEPEPFLHRPLKMERDDSKEGDANQGSGSNTTTTNASEQQTPNNS